MIFFFFKIHNNFLDLLICFLVDLPEAAFSVCFSSQTSFTLSSLLGSHATTPYTQLPPTAVIAAEGKYRTPADILKMREQATLHQRHAGGDTADQSTCLLDDALPGDSLFHLAARAFAPEVGECKEAANELICTECTREE